MDLLVAVADRERAKRKLAVAADQKETVAFVVRRLGNAGLLVYWQGKRWNHPRARWMRILHLPECQIPRFHSSGLLVVRVRHIADKVLHYLSEHYYKMYKACVCIHLLFVPVDDFLSVLYSHSNTVRLLWSRIAPLRRVKWLFSFCINVCHGISDVNLGKEAMNLNR